MRVPPEETRRPRVPHARRRRTFLIVLLVLVLIALLSVQGIATFYTNYLWYKSVGLTPVWRTIIGTKVELAVVFCAIMFVAVWVTLWATDQLAPRAILFAPELELVRRYQAAIGPHILLVRTAISAVIAFVVGTGAASEWQSWLLFIHAKQFPGLTDPLFHKNVGWFVFRLPFLTFLVDWAMLALVVVFVVTAIAHYLNGSIRVQGASPRVDPVAIAHLSLILGLLALAKAISYLYIQRPQIEYSSRGVVQGANYTDVHVLQPALTLLAVIAFVIFAALAYNVYRRSIALPLIGVGLWAVVAAAIGFIYPAIIQGLKVTPAQSSLELPYIASNIAATRDGFNIANVSQQSYPANVTDPPSTSAITQYQQTLDGLDLWNPSITSATYDKLQDQRAYFTLSGLAVDRYPVSSQKDPSGALVPFVVGVRTLQSSGIQSPSWVNSHLQYTHGYGAILSPANTANAADGTPVFGISNVPPSYNSAIVGLPKQQTPAVYFGTQSTNYVVVDSAQQEIDYTQISNSGQVSSQPQESHYAGSGGVPIGSVWSRLAFSIRFHDLNLLISKLITPQSKIIFVQDVRQMVQSAAPFLQVDSNPYPVLDSDGQIYWIVDAYTTSAFFPYSQNADTSSLAAGSGLQGQYNYVRNSVKVVINAYTGKMQFYAVDQTDPLLQAYEDAFPNMFQPLSTMDSTLQEHLRYPQDLLMVQAAMYGRYHLTNASAFYSAANAWQMAQEAGTGLPSQSSSGPNGSSTRFVPLYEILQTNGGQPGFDAVEPLVPFSTTDRLQTLSGLLVAGCDYTDYGQLTVYTMPPDLDGPALVDSEINATPKISQQITYLDQRGSSVTLGDVIVLPIDGSLIYVRPLYLSSSTNKFPQLQDVIVVFGRAVGMEPTFSAALQDVLTTAQGLVGVGPNGLPSGSIPASVRGLITQA
ncbi:MAG TPA: UPF0182 family protein, partial [Acidimicrobiales bacterium]|nr:UPF0182 family protein [Acidimicrobiales bacterium]